MKTKFQFSKELIRQFVINASGFLTSVELDKLITSFEAETTNYYFSSSSESNLIRIINAQLDKTSLFSDALKYPHLIEVMIAIAAYSNYLTDILVRNPEFIYLIFKDNFLQKPLSHTELNKEIKHILRDNTTPRTLTEYLKFIQRKSILKIGLRDILGIATLPETVNEISILAYSITSTLFEQCLLEVFKKYQIKPQLSRHLIIALGKLGGNELNYSSDIDLIIIFDKNSKLRNSNKEYFEILNEAIQLFTSLASQASNGGFLYRVDFRLRPDGNFAPLARTFSDTINYYETRGELWEKQMLIKANYLTGSKNLYNKFLIFRDQFSFSSSFSSSPLDKIEKMKYEIEKKYSNGQNVKTFSGGIRDIEFSIQALQLLNGNKHKNLRFSNTLATIKELSELNILTKKEEEIFTNSYILFRKVEHFLQLINNSQTHDIPEDNEIRTKIASYLNFDSVAKFDKTITENRIAVRNIFNSIFQIDKPITSQAEFEQIRFANNKRAKTNIDFLKQGSSLSHQKSFDSKTISLFEKLEPTLLNYLTNSIAPDKVLENFVKLIGASTFPSILYSEFQNKEYFNKVLSICELSQLAVDLMSGNKALIDTLISREAFSKNLGNNLDTIPLKQLQLSLAIQYALNLLDENSVSKTFAKYFKIQLAKIISEMNINYSFFIAALGSFGIEEMNFFSDLDLIVVVKEIEDREKMEKDFQFFLQIARKTFPSIEIDFRLRPEGKSSLLLSDIDNFQKYLNTRADFWEFLTLQKIDFISGNNNLFNEFENMIIKIMSDKLPSISATDILQIHGKSTLPPSPTGNTIFDIKKSTGGFLTIDYLIETLLIKSPQLLNKILGMNLIEKVTLIKNNIELDFDVEIIIKNYTKLKMILLSQQNYFNTPGYKLKSTQTEKELFAKTLGYNNYTALQSEIMSIAKSNFMLLQKLLK